MHNGIIYRAISPSNKLYYGKTVRSLQKRILEHYRRKVNWSFSNALRKYGIEKFKFEIIETHSSESLKELNDKLSEREKYWIKLHKTTNPKNGYNMTKGGDGTPGHSYIFSEEHIQKLRESHRGIIQSEEQKRKKSQKLLGRKKTEEHKKHISEGRKGIIFSKEHCENMRKAKLGKKRDASKNNS